MGPGNRKRETPDKIPHREDELTRRGALGFSVAVPPMTPSRHCLASDPSSARSALVRPTFLFCLPTRRRLRDCFGISRSRIRMGKHPDLNLKESKLLRWTFLHPNGLKTNTKKCTRFLLGYLSLLRPDVQCSAVMLIALLMMRKYEPGGIS
jgi:hypothetical protein